MSINTSRLAGGKPLTEAHPDIRVIRSVALMEQALLRILKEEGIKGLTVKHLCKIAGINRGTFYLHYRDIFHLIEETAFFQGLLSVFEPFDYEDLMNHPDQAYPPLIKAFQYLHLHAALFKTLICSGAPAELRDRLQYLTGTRMYENFKKSANGKDESSDYAVSYLGNAQFGVIQHWFMTDRALPPEVVARLLSRFIRKSSYLVE